MKLCINVVTTEEKKLSYFVDTFNAYMMGAGINPSDICSAVKFNIVIYKDMALWDIVDDVGFIAGRDNADEEQFCVFNESRKFYKRPDILRFVAAVDEWFIKFHNEGNWVV